MNKDLIPLNITIGDRNYRIKILVEHEAQVRKTIKLINEKIIEFRGQFAGKDIQDYIAMVLIWFATQPAKALDDLSNEEISQSLQSLEEQVKEMESDI